LQNQVVGQRQNLSVTLGKARLQILHHAGILTDLIEEVGGAIKTPRCSCDRNGSSSRLLRVPWFSFLPRGNDLVGFRIHATDAFASCPGLPLILVPVRNRLVCIRDARLLIRLINDCRHVRSPFLVTITYIVTM
ncbi:MAG TPA: hypothetical protein PLY62_08910, partial [Bacteroidales bacterium]|nr:hypothetical protein [Bacteroidales bacterium]